MTDNIPVRNAGERYGSGEAMIQLDNLRCQGNEDSLLRCLNHIPNQHSCSNSDVAGVRCGGKSECPHKFCLYS